VVPDSASFTVNVGGPYYFVATYSGDSNNNAVSGVPEPFTVIKATPKLTTTPPSGAIAGMSFFDSATLSSATTNAGGTVTYTLFLGVYPSGSQVGNPSQVTVVNSIVSNSASFNVVINDSYYFVASYSGDANNNAAFSPSEPFTVSIPPYSGQGFYFNASSTQGQNLSTEPPTTQSKINSFISDGQPSGPILAQNPLASSMRVSDTISVTMYVGTTQPVSELDGDVGFWYQGTYYDIGTGKVYNMPQQISSTPYLAVITITANKMYFLPGFPALTIPAGSTIQFVATAPGYLGRITLYYGTGQLSRINF
jgi:hypothetical protein